MKEERGKRVGDGSKERGWGKREGEGRERVGEKREEGEKRVTVGEIKRGLEGRRKREGDRGK